MRAPQRDTEEKEPLSVEQAEAVMANLLDHDMDAFETGLFLLMTTGMRLSEMLALTWMEYDEGESTLHVRHSMERDTQERKSTKTKETRTIPLMPAAKAVLLEWRSRQQAYFKARGLRWSKGRPICHNSKGTHILSSAYERWWRNNRDRLGVPEFATLHTMRHTFATILIVNCGVDTSTAQSLTGHTKPDVLLQIYAHTHQGARPERWPSWRALCSPTRASTTALTASIGLPAPIRLTSKASAGPRPARSPKFSKAPTPAR